MQGNASPCVFWHRQTDIKALVHGDDMSFGERTELELLCKGLKKKKKKFETKMIMVGEDDDLAKKARVLNRIVRWHPRKGATEEADPRHAETISRDTGAEKLKAVSTPATKEPGRETEEERRQYLCERRLSGKLGDKIDDGNNGNTLSADEMTRYRRTAARANFLAQDRVDIAFATKKAPRRMTSPTNDDWNELVRPVQVPKLI